HRGVQSVLEVDERVRRPEALSDLVPRDDLPSMFHQHLEKAEGLLGQRDAGATTSKLPRGDVEFEFTELDRIRRRGVDRHAGQRAESYHSRGRRARIVCDPQTIYLQ